MILCFDVFIYRRQIFITHLNYFLPFLIVHFLKVLVVHFLKDFKGRNIWKILFELISFYWFRRVLYQLIIKHLNLREAELKYNKPPVCGGRLTIPVRKYDTEVFRMLIQFVHSGTATITDTAVFGENTLWKCFLTNKFEQL
jgi:hypothetical protein